MTEFTEIASRLKALRGHLSQKDFSEKIGVPFRTYQYYESGIRAPKGKVLAQIAERCGVTVDWILTGLTRLTAARADRVTEPAASYLDDVTRKVLQMMDQMTGEEKRTVLKYVQAQKHLVEEMKKQREG